MMRITALACATLGFVQEPEASKPFLVKEKPVPEATGKEAAKALSKAQRARNALKKPFDIIRGYRPSKKAKAAASVATIAAALAALDAYDPEMKHQLSEHMQKLPSTIQEGFEHAKANDPRSFEDVQNGAEVAFQRSRVSLNNGLEVTRQGLTNGFEATREGLNNGLEATRQGLNNGLEATRQGFNKGYEKGAAAWAPVQENLRGAFEATKQIPEKTVTLAQSTYQKLLDLASRGAAQSTNDAASQAETNNDAASQAESNNFDINNFNIDASIEEMLRGNTSF